MKILWDNAMIDNYVLKYGEHGAIGLLVRVAGLFLMLAERPIEGTP